MFLKPARLALVIAATAAVTVCVLAVRETALAAGAAQRTAATAPYFEVDPVWPKPLPNHWVLGNVIGVGVDARDHVFIVHRNDNVQRDAGNRRRAESAAQRVFRARAACDRVRSPEAIS